MDEMLVDKDDGNGLVGSTGSNGSNGPNGPNGPNGLNGSNIPNGSDGSESELQMIQMVQMVQLVFELVSLSIFHFPHISQGFIFNFSFRTVHGSWIAACWNSR